jgi:hypothetical protein
LPLPLIPCLCPSAPYTLAAPSDCVDCKVCGNLFKLKDMRTHVGEHVLQCSRADPSDSNLDLLLKKVCEHLNVFRASQLTLEHQIGTEPCGFCGLDTAPSSECKTHLSLNRSNNLTVKSTCQYQFGFTQACQLSSKKIWNTLTNQCTNHRMRCPLCKIHFKGEQSTVWSYNFVLHLWNCHTIDSLGTVPPVTPKTWTESYVSKAEEASMGVNLALTKAFRSRNDVPNSNDLDDHNTTQELDEDNANMAGGPSTASTKRVRPRSEAILSTTSSQAQGRCRKTHKVK